MYKYETERPKLFTDEGQRKFLLIRDRVKLLLKQAGAARMEEILRAGGGSDWEGLACVDRLVELGELIELTPSHCVAQYRVFTENVL